MPLGHGQRARVGDASRPAAVLDGLMDGALVAFALWTLLYEVALWRRLSLWPVAWLWLPVAVAVLVLAVVWHLRRADPPPEVGTEPDRPARPPSDALRLGLLLAVSLPVGLLVFVFGNHEAAFPLVWGVSAVAFGGLVVALARGRLGAPPTVEAPQPAGGARPFEHWVVLVVGLALAVFASLLLNTDADDVYYVNRSVWVAQHGVPSLRDTIFSAERFAPPYAGGLPLASVEGLLGALAHVFGTAAGSMTYLVSVPLVSFAMVWATWRLVQEWAPRRRVLVLLAALAFVLVDGSAAIGNYAFGRIWQGKVMAICLLVPLIWYHATRLARRPSRHDLVMMLVIGVCFVGLTSTSAILVPTLSAALVAAAWAMRSRPLALGAVLVSIAPVLSGLAVVAFSSGVGGDAPQATSPWFAFWLVFGAGHGTAALAMAALVVAPLLVRPGPVRVLAVAATLLVIVPLTPGYMALVNAATGAGPVVWRLLLAAPLATVVGLLVAVDWGFVRRGIGTGVVAGTSAVVAVVLLTSHAPLWSPAVGAVVTSRPTWKVDQRALADVRVIARLPTGDGPVLLPYVDMTTLALVTTEKFAVVPRDLYAAGLDEPRSARRARLRLYRLIAGHRPVPTRAQTDRALARLDVSLVCAPRSDKRVLRKVERAGYERLRRVHDLVCLRPSTTAKG